MTNFTSIIKQVETEFDNIYRITAENGLVLDISENKKPNIGSKIEYYINNSTIETVYTIMNGIIFNKHDTGILVSFGGLLANIPIHSSEIKTEYISLSYKIIE